MSCAQFSCIYIYIYICLLFDLKRIFLSYNFYDVFPFFPVSGEDIVNDNDQLKLGLKKVIHRMALRYESENGESFFRAPAAAAAAAAAAGKTTTAAVRDQSSSIVAPDEIVTS